MVARLLRVSVSLAEKPKSAIERLANHRCGIGKRRLTDLDVATAIEQNVVTLDISMDDTLSVKML